MNMEKAQLVTKKEVQTRLQVKQLKKPKPRTCTCNSFIQIFDMVCCFVGLMRSWQFLLLIAVSCAGSACMDPPGSPEACGIA